MLELHQNLRVVSPASAHLAPALATYVYALPMFTKQGAKRVRWGNGKRKERKKLHENQLRASADDSRIMKKSLVRSVHKLQRISSSSLNPE